jgi:hypothetical protein
MYRINTILNTIFRKQLMSQNITPALKFSNFITTMLFHKVRLSVSWDKKWKL